MSSEPRLPRIAIIGFGEVGGIFGHDLAKQGIPVSVFDILFASGPHRQPMLSKASRCGVGARDSLKDCVSDADLVISAVTASSALDVAKQVGNIVRSKQVFLDINSVSPQTKRKAAGYVARKQAIFV